jgi:hypothetical protein
MRIPAIMRIVKPRAVSGEPLERASFEGGLRPPSLSDRPRKHALEGTRYLPLQIR